MVHMRQKADQSKQEISESYGSDNACKNDQYRFDWRRYLHDGDTGKRGFSANEISDAPGISVGDVVSRCRDIVVSPYLLHHVRNHLTVKKGDPISRGRISRGFQTARERTSLQWDHPPTFHEIRSLSGRLFKDQGVDAQALLGHKDSKTTSKYLDGRGIEWISVG